jgi:hypothetical protein
MDRFLDITEFVVVANLENRAINYGIDKAKNLWRNRHNKDGPPINNVNNIPNQVPPPQMNNYQGQFASPPINDYRRQVASPPINDYRRQVPSAPINDYQGQFASAPINDYRRQVSPPSMGVIPGQLLVTVLRGEDLYEPRLSMLSAASSERPYVVIECNQQRFQTAQASSHSPNRNPKWTSKNGPFTFNIFDPNADRLTVWIQQDPPLMKHTGPKMLGMCEINVGQLIGQQKAWLPLRKDNRPAGQVLLEIAFLSEEDLDAPPPYYRGR